MRSASFGGLPLNAYLIMPIQRIPRYRMLLEVLVGSTPEEHSDYKQLSEALGVVRDVANYINTHIAKEVRDVIHSPLCFFCFFSFSDRTRTTARAHDRTTRAT